VTADVVARTGPERAGGPEGLTERDRPGALDRPLISLACLTAGPLHQVAAILALYRPVVDEIVCAVNGRFRADELAPLDGLADRVIPVEIGSDFLQERYRSWLYGQCKGELVCTVDTDEVPSAALLAALRDLAAARDVVTYLTLCRWCYPDPAHYLDEYPWDPSWKMILVRNDPATLHIRGGVHEGVMAAPPYRFLELPVYHLSDATTPTTAREAKVAFYDGLDGRQLLEDGRPVSEVFYLPERHSLHPPAPLPPEDLALVTQVLAADVSADRVLERESAPGPAGGGESPPGGEALLPGTVAYETVLESWPERPLPESAYRARVELRQGRTPLRDVREMHAGERRAAMARVENLGTASWLRELRNRVSLSARFFDATPDGGRGALALECGRFAFPADVHPGEVHLLPFELPAPGAPGAYVLVVDLVEEGVRWFEQGTEMLVQVHP
jgi:hypothetical protein